MLESGIRHYICFRRDVVERISSPRHHITLQERRLKGLGMFLRFFCGFAIYTTVYYLPFTSFFLCGLQTLGLRSIFYNATSPYP